MLRKLISSTIFAAFALSAGSQALATTPTVDNKPAIRGEVPANGRASMHVHAIVLEDLKQFVTDQKVAGPLFLRMVLLSKQEAIGASCDAYSLDQKLMTGAMMRTVMPMLSGLEKDVATSNLNRTLRQYNTLLGGELAQFGYDPTGYCASGKELFDQLATYPAQDSMLVLKAN